MTIDDQEDRFHFLNELMGYMQEIDELHGGLSPSREGDKEYGKLIDIAGDMLKEYRKLDLDWLE